jgi:hypothetical protein
MSKTLQIGVSRPALQIEDLPEPEEVFQAKHIGLKQLIFLVLGPSLIALGVAIGSGEWLLGPLTFGKYGFIGIGWIVLVSAILQVFYNVEIARIIMATGEPPVTAFGRVPPGYFFWIPFAVFLIYLAHIWGGWVSSCGASLFALITGRVPKPTDLQTVRWLAILLLVGIYLMTMVGKKIERTLELANWIMVPFMIFSLLIIGITIVPAAHWGIAFASLFIPAAPPKGSDPALLGAVAGFTALAAGLNFMYMGYYKEKGYGMGHKIGYIASLTAKQPPILAVGKTFPEDEKNASLWKRWFRYLVIDQWVIFFPGAIIGMMLPSIIVWYLAGLPDVPKPTIATMPTYAAEQLSKLAGVAGSLFFYWALLIGFFILFSTQLGVFESMVRNFTDMAYLNTRFRESIMRGDPRRFYFPFMFVLLVAIAILIHTALPVDLLVISANMANFASLIFPFVLMYLISKLPRPAKAPWWSYVVLSLNVIFFGFFFINFACSRIFGVPLVKF